jgi:hypothetical protein
LVLSWFIQSGCIPVPDNDQAHLPLWSGTRNERSGIAVRWSALFGILFVFQKLAQAVERMVIEHSLNILELHSTSH